MLKKQIINRVHNSTFVKNSSSFIVMFFLSFSLFSQDQQLADSLESIYIKGAFEEEYRLQLIEQLAIQHHHNEAKIKYSNELLALAKEMDSSQFFYTAYLEKGNAYYQLGEMPEAIDNFLMAGDIAIKNNDSIRLASIYGSVANVFEELGNLETGVSFYKKSIDIFKNNLFTKNDTLKFATSKMNLGYSYIELNKPDSALIYLDESETLFRQINDTILLAYNQLNKGTVYALKKDYLNAEKNINKAFPVIEKKGHFGVMCQTLIEISEIYFVKNEIERASEFAYRSLDLAKEHNLKSEISRASLQLSKIYHQTGNDKQAMVFYKNHIIYRDSVTNLSSFQEIANMRTEFEVAQKQTEIDLKQSEVELLNQQKTNQKVLIFTMIVILGMTGLYYRNISKEKKRSDDLLLNILPTKTAEELKDSGKVQAKKFESVTVMFTDFTAFTKHSQTLTPEVLVKSVDFYFSKFDAIIDRYGLEKIKTIGDAYMCAGGLPFKTDDHAKKMVKAAMEIASFIKASKDKELGNIAHFEIRIGINTGPVVAGVVGSKKFAYDIWGDTVNVAARMESNSESGMINISENTYALVKNDFECEYRGEIDVKNKGMMKMYYVHGKKQGFYDLHHKKHSRPEPVFNEKDDIPI